MQLMDNEVNSEGSCFKNGSLVKTGTGSQLTEIFTKSFGGDTVTLQHCDTVTLL